jgi:uncharacterized protein (DUF488 family)
VLLKIATIGVYGFDKDSFFQALLDAKVDTFCDIRRRRGVRGSAYAFANSENLQRRLGELGIRYVYIKELAPSNEVREKQDLEDKQLHIAKRKRTTLRQEFIRAYEQECLAHYDAPQFLEAIGEEAQVVALFCVEREPQACHRSLAAKRLARDLGLSVEHITPGNVPLVG